MEVGAAERGPAAGRAGGRAGGQAGGQAGGWAGRPGGMCSEAKRSGRGPTDSGQD